ncbi:membrane-targeted effector domain-containing toxin [Pseudomonas sp. KU43P]|uniref:membrane-targeted effector domain-containing toxin n=1 Tax=Pseudomonas sp. KU43P TaxID=2487887 RepID=UPI0012A7EC1A|nr:membrane-targeted effector domain-containing toxin [Pseudomonas sp. KU43P]BBH44582.1 hypothetical protein KU43P_10590 [Pseudomonas sp. KU43P]
MTLNPQQQKALDQLQQLAPVMVASCPDMRQMAREVACDMLRARGFASLDPDQVFLNRFAMASTCPHTFSGWEHYETPLQSFTLPQLVMHRFDAQDQDNADLLSYLAGFYRDGADHNQFDERNEIPIAPRDVLADFWKIDFCTRFQQRLTQFWNTHADDFRTLAKVSFLSKVNEAQHADATSELAKRARLVAQALVGTCDWPPTLEQLQQEVPPASGYRLRTFDIGGYPASDILRVEMDDGYQLLYIPGEDEPLQLFANQKDLYWWVLNTTNAVDNRTRFMGHFALSSYAQGNTTVGLNHLIDLLFFNWGGDDHPGLNTLDGLIHGDAFSHLRDNARQRMNDDAHFALRSNADLRKQMWIGYLQAFGQVFGPMSAVGWPVALAVVGAGVAEVGLNIDQAIHGHTTAERQAGTVGAILAAINTLFNAPFLFSSPAGELNEIEIPSGQLPEPVPDDASTLATQAQWQDWVPPSQPIGEGDEALRPLRANVTLTGEPGSGAMEGIYEQDGNHYVMIHAQPYQVRQVAELHTWVVVDPVNPFSFQRNVPIRRMVGQWRPFERPNLRGGGFRLSMLRLWGRPPSAPTLPELSVTPYEVPVEQRPAMKRPALKGDLNVLSGVTSSADTAESDRLASMFRGLRDRLLADADTFLQSTQLPYRPEAPELPRQASPKQIIRSVFERCNGLVIGEGHSELGSKRFLIDNMAQLKKAQVKVLYMEHFMTEFHQAELDQFNRTGQMSPELRKYVQGQDTGHFTDRAGRYTFEQVMISAQKQGIRIQPIDCVASYRQAWEDLPPALARQKMMNYFAHLIIEADQSVRGPGKWVALVGNSHANTFEGVPGISELEGVIGLRIEDIAASKVGGIGPDPGMAVPRHDLSVRTVKGDLRLQVAIRPARPAQLELQGKLGNPGDFTFSTLDGQLQLIHRSRDGLFKYTPVQQHGRYFQVDTPDWPWISGRHLAGLQEMRSLLERWGLRYRE